MVGVLWSCQATQAKFPCPLAAVESSCGGGVWQSGQVTQARLSGPLSALKSSVDCGDFQFWILGHLSWEFFPLARTAPGAQQLAVVALGAGREGRSDGWHKLFGIS